MVKDLRVLGSLNYGAAYIGQAENTELHLGSVKNKE